MKKAISGGWKSQSMLGKEGRRRKVEEVEKRGNSENGERDWRGKGEYDDDGQEANRDPNGVSYGLLPNLWLSQLLEKHNQVLAITNHL